MTGVQELAQRIHSARVAQGVGGDFKSLRAELDLLDRYGSLPEDGSEYTYQPIDDGGRRFTILSSLRRPYLVAQALLNYDVFVFAKLGRDSTEFVGWIDRDQVEEAPVHWVIRQGKRVDYAHVVKEEFLNPLPWELDFNVACEHDASYWNYDIEGWECLICSRGIYDEYQYRSERDSGWSSKNAAGESGT